jgi:hypothetical protein
MQRLVCIGTSSSGSGEPLKTAQPYNEFGISGSGLSTLFVSQHKQQMSVEQVLSDLDRAMAAHLDSILYVFDKTYDYIHPPMHRFQAVQESNFFWHAHKQKCGK